MSIKSKIEYFATAMLAVCAVVVTVLFIRREFLLRPPANAARTRLADWKEYSSGTKTIGPANAPVTILEVSDFQCPYCRKFSRAVQTAQAKFPEKILLVYVNYPLTELHAQARAAATAAECAAQQNRFAAYHDYLFTKQDSLATMDWARVAAVVGISDTGAFSKCLTSSDVLARLRADSTVADQLKIAGTPTVWVNGWKFDGTPTSAQLDSAISSELKMLTRTR